MKVREGLQKFASVFEPVHEILVDIEFCWINTATAAERNKKQLIVPMNSIAQFFLYRNLNLFVNQKKYSGILAVAQ